MAAVNGTAGQEAIAKPMMDNPPSSVLIIGSGVFGLSTAWALTKRSLFNQTRITVVDNCGGKYPAEDCASSDSSRIIRADYPDADYTELAAEAQKEWRKQGDDDLGGQGRYSEPGFVLTAYDSTKGMNYSKDSWKNVAKLAGEHGYPRDKIKVLENREALNECLGTQGKPGDWGYLNTLSGWADATEGMKWLYKQVKATGRVDFVDAEVEELVPEGKRVVGARLKDGTVLKGDIVMVAAGAWTGRLVDLRGRTEATGHPLGYIEITEQEQQLLSKQPVVLNLSSGLFVLPPRDRVLKLARHSFGYVNPQTVSFALPLSPAHERRLFVTSQPHTSRDGGISHFPAEADRDLRRALADLVPIKGLEKRPWKQTRLCWYSDTLEGDWLVDWHPGWEGLFIATGDSGHGFKFLPVLGEKVLDCILRQGGKLGEKWRWRDVEDEEMGKEKDGMYTALITRDGSRGGYPGMVLKQELEKQ